MTLPEPIDRIIRQVLGWRRVVRIQRVLTIYINADGSLMAAGLAYHALVAFLTGLLLVIGIVGFVVKDPVIREKLLAEVVGLVPPLEPIARLGLDGLAANAGAFSILGLAGLAWGASGFYGALDQSFARIFRALPVRTMVSRLARGLISVGLLVAIVAAAFVLAAIQQRLVEALPGGSEGDGGRLLSSIVFPLLTLSLVPIAVGLLFRVVPNTWVPLFALGPPAVLVGIALALLTQLFVFIAPRLIGALNAFGALATVFAGLAWLSLVFQALLIGAAWTRLRMDVGDETNPPASEPALEPALEREPEPGAPVRGGAAPS